MAARLSAKRIAELHGSELGTTVGYQVRFEKQSSAATRLLAATPGILLRQLVDDPTLKRVSCVLLDEFHERSVEYDLLLGILLRLRQSLRPDLRIIVMSATLNCEELQSFIPSRARSSVKAGAIRSKYATQALPSMKGLNCRSRVRLNRCWKRHLVTFLSSYPVEAKSRKSIDT